MLLLIETLLLISATLQDHGADAHGMVLPLDMALNSVDDQYAGCTREMAQQVKEAYLPKELNISKSNFREAWQEATKMINQPDNNLSMNHLIAIRIYTGYKVFANFKNDSYHGGKNYTNKKYEWYSLHFLLTEAIQILKKTQNECFHTYRGTKLKYELLNVSSTNSKQVRFGSFASSSEDKNKTTFFGNESCFEIHTCKGANIANYSKLPHEKEVLIPPYEMFNVTEVKIIEDQKDLWCKTVFVLNSTGIRSDLNCALFRRKNKAMKKHYTLH